MEMKVDVKNHTQYPRGKSGPHKWRLRRAVLGDWRIGHNLFKSRNNAALPVRHLLNLRFILVNRYPLTQHDFWSGGSCFCIGI